MWKQCLRLQSEADADGYLFRTYQVSVVMHGSQLLSSGHEYHLDHDSSLLDPAHPRQVNWTLLTKPNALLVEHLIDASLLVHCMTKQSYQIGGGGVGFKAPLLPSSKKSQFMDSVREHASAVTTCKRS